MITITEIADRTVGELAVERPMAIRVFEAWKIDYCCGGQTSLRDACAIAGKTVEAFVVALESMATIPASHDWAADNLKEMATNIVATYHQYTRQELEAIQPLAEKVLSVHGDRRPELSDVVILFAQLRDDMLPHMLREEQVLFPYVNQLEEAAEGNRIAPTPFFGTVRNPVRKMMEEHERVGELLASLREVTDEYQPPESACFSYRELYRRLAELEQRTHEHVHVENNLYFPRAIALEDKSGKTAAFGEGCGPSCKH